HILLITILVLQGYRSLLPSFSFQRPVHELRGGLESGFILVEKGVDAGCYRHFNVETASQLVDSSGGLHTLGHLDHIGKDVGQLAAFSQLNADSRVTAETAGTGKTKVPQAGKARQGLDSAAQSQRQPGHLGQSTRYYSGDGVVAKSQTSYHPGCDRNDILDRASKFHAR